MVLQVNLQDGWRLIASLSVANGIAVVKWMPFDQCRKQLEKRELRFPCFSNREG
jgi:hypothetical protein